MNTILYQTIYLQQLFQWLILDRARAKMYLNLAERHRSWRGIILSVEYEYLLSSRSIYIHTDFKTTTAAVALAWEHLGSVLLIPSCRSRLAAARSLAD